VAGTVDFVHGVAIGTGSVWSVLELADSQTSYRILVRDRIACLSRQLPCVSVVVISSPATAGIPRWVEASATDCGWSPAGTAADRVRVYQRPSPTFTDQGGADRRRPDRAGPRHPGNGSALPPRVLSLWAVGPKANKVGNGTTP
jgi:hypothetical protein